MFDPYRDWLGIAAQHRPLDAYSLLGLPFFEAQPHVIAAAAEQQLARVRKWQGTEYAAWVPPLEQELIAARNGLLSPAKQEYDAALRRAMQPQASAPQAVQELLPPTAPAMALPVGKAIERKAEEEPPPKEGRSASRLIKLAIGGVITIALLVCVWQLWAMFSPPQSTANTKEEETETGPPGVETNPDQVVEVPEEAPKEPAAETKPKRTERIVLNQEGNGEVQFTPITAKLSGGVELISRGTDSVIGNWLLPADEIQWTFRLKRADIFRVQITYAAPDEWEGTRYVVNFDDEPKERTTRTSGSIDKTIMDEFFVPIVKAGEHKLTLRMVSKPGAEAMILHSVRLVPTKQ